MVVVANIVIVVLFVGVVNLVCFCRGRAFHRSYMAPSGAVSVLNMK